MSQRPHILHLHSSFDLGAESRAVRLMNAWGDQARHTIVSGVPGAMGAVAAIAPGVSYELAQAPPPLTGRPSVTRYEAIARFMRRFDLVLTYNWGAIDGVMARRVFSKGVPPLVHHEDGFNEDEAGGLKSERNAYRRLALGAAHALVVPSRILEGIALGAWKQPPARVHRIVNGIAVDRYVGKPDPRAIPGFRRKSGDIVIGTLAGLRAVKDLPMLVRAAGGLAGPFQLVIVGEGPERANIQQAAMAMGIGDRVHLPGFLPDPSRFLRAFDVFALSSRSEQFPISVVEAMAAGLPVASPPVGDVPVMVSAANQPLICSIWGEVYLRDAMQLLVGDADLRGTVGAANQALARAEYGESMMISAYARLYNAAMGKPGLLPEAGC